MKLIRGVFKLIVVIIFFVVAYNVCKLTPFYIDKTTYEKNEIRMIINDSEKTKSLPERVIIEDNEVLVSIDTIRKYIDEYFYFDEKYKTLIAASGDTVLKLPLNSQIIEINDEYKNITKTAKIVDYYEDVIYVPAEEIFELYDMTSEEIKEFLNKLYNEFQVAYSLPTELNEEMFLNVNKFKISGVEKNSRDVSEIPINVDGKILFSVNLIKKYFNLNVEINEVMKKVELSFDYTDKETLEEKRKVLIMPFNKNNVTIEEYKYDEENNLKRLEKIEKKINVPTQKIQTIYEVLYVPIKELSDVYNIDVKYNEKVIITTRNSEYYTVTVANKIHTKKYEKEYCLTTEVVDKDEKLEIFNSDFEILDDNSYVWVRTEEGSLGYVKKSNIKIEKIESNFILNKVVENNRPRISLTWEYASNYTPDRSNEKKIEGLDIVSPTWVYVKNTSGDIKENVSQSYINWALKQGYDVWPTIKNDDIGIDKTSVLLNDMHARKNFIDEIISLCKKYNFKGINLDFEHMYKNDREEYAQLVRELSCTLKRNGIISSVDVNVPDGSANWSLCFDSKAISDAVDYIIVMTYDQYGASSITSGPVASLAWVEVNLKKMIERDGIDNEKLVLGVPFYSRLWKEKNGVVTSTSAISMSTAKQYMIDNKNNTTWNEIAGQYLVEYSTKTGDVVIWIEDENSLEKKLELMNKYELAGVASWRRGFETTDVWEKIEEAMK